MMMKKTICMLFLFSFAVFAGAQSHLADSLKKAGEYYKEGLFEKAIDRYESIVDSGFYSADLYYNLGNAYYKTNNIAKAILNYEKASVLNPGDEKTEHNLKLANARVIDKIDDLPEPFIISLLIRVRNAFKIEVWALLSIIAFFIGATGILLFFVFRRIVYRKMLFFTAIFLFLVSIFMFLMGLSRHNQLNHKTMAIVIEPSVTIKSEPTMLGAELYILHEGTKVEVVNTEDDWLEIRLSDGNTGWLKSNYIEEI